MSYHRNHISFSTSTIKEIASIDYPSATVKTYRGLGKVEAKGFSSIIGSQTDLKIGKISYGKGVVTSITKADSNYLGSVRDIGIITKGYSRPWLL